jgi:hypothetical protein
MKNVMLVLTLVLAAACNNNKPNDGDVDIDLLSGNVAIPATQYNLLSTFTAALPCAGQPLVWSIREQSVGWNATLDGIITQTGLWTSPACGSVWLGQILHVDAVCTATGQTASAAIATVAEQVSGVQIAYAVVTNPGKAACLAPNPITPPIQAGGSIQFYARVLTTCGEVITPTPPATWPAVCT